MVNIRWRRSNGEKVDLARYDSTAWGAKAPDRTSSPSMMDALRQLMRADRPGAQAASKGGQVPHGGSEPPGTTEMRQVVLSGDFATASAGGFAFTVGRTADSVQLHVRRQEGDKAGEYFTLSNLLGSKWIRLASRSGQPLPFRVSTMANDVTIVFDDLKESPPAS